MSKIKLNLIRKLTKDSSTFPLFDLIKFSVYRYVGKNKKILIKLGPNSLKSVYFFREWIRENVRSNKKFGEMVRYCGNKFT